MALLSYQLLSVLALATLSAAQADCTLTLPKNPLSAEGLATPFESSGCDQRQFADQGNFVEAGILDPATGNLTIYHPLVVNKGDKAGKDFITPTAVTLPSSAVVALWFGSNANSLTLAGDTNGCVNGIDGSIFGQVAYCNAPAFFTAAQKAISAKQLNLDAPGMAANAQGQSCIAGTRDFRMVDMDQSDNVVTTYLLIDGHKLAQNTPANAKDNKNATELSNGSDNALLDDFLQPIMGCNSLQVPSLTAPSGMTKALALNELLSQVFPPSTPALVPENDPMVVDANGNADLQKLNLYRAGMGQPAAASLADANGTEYCRNFAAAGIFAQQNAKLFTAGGSPNPAAGNNLFTFLANRFAASFGPVPALGCETIFGLADSPVAQASDAAGVVTSASINAALLSSILDGKIQGGGAGAATTTTTTKAAGKTGGGGGKDKGSSAAATATGGGSVAQTTTRRHRTRPSGLGSGRTTAAGTSSAAASVVSGITSDRKHRTRPGRSSSGADAEATSAETTTSRARGGRPDHTTEAAATTAAPVDGNGGSSGGGAKAVGSGNGKKSCATVTVTFYA